MELLNFGPKKLGFGCMRLPMSEGTVGGEGVVDTRQVWSRAFAILTQPMDTSLKKVNPLCANAWWSGIPGTAIC